MSKLHLVFGGRVSDPQGLDFVDLANLDVVGLYPDYKSAEKAWRSAAQRTVDDAEMKYVVVHLHKLFQSSLNRPGLLPPSFAGVVMTSFCLKLSGNCRRRPEFSGGARGSA